jgi:hypothetical protein
MAGQVEDAAGVCIELGLRQSRRFFLLFFLLFLLLLSCTAASARNSLKQLQRFDGGKQSSCSIKNSPSRLTAACDAAKNTAYRRGYAKETLLQHSMLVRLGLQRWRCRDMSAQSKGHDSKTGPHFDDCPRSATQNSK